MHSRIIMLLIFAFIILLFSSIALISSSMALVASDRIFYGVRIAGDISLGGLTPEEAEQQINDFCQKELQSQPIITLNHSAKSWQIKPEEIDFHINAAATSQAAYQVGRESNLLKRLWMRLESTHHGIQIPIQTSYNKEKLAKIIQLITEEVSCEQQNAYCDIVDNKVVLIPEKNGVTLPTEKILPELNNRLSAFSSPLVLALPTVETTPAIKTDQLADINTILAVYSSEFNHYNYNRSENIRIAANSINRFLLPPEQTFSFNDLVGLRIAEAGFKEAPVIVDGKTVPDIGGGVCQVSSTLYNAILLADLQPIERQPHFHPLGYAPIGLDATVADNLIDFRFKNSLAYNVYFITKIVDGTLSIFVLGNDQALGNAKITLTSTIEKEIAPPRKIEYTTNLPPGKVIVSEEGITGYIVSSYRIKSVNGQEVSRERLYTDEYQAEPEVLLIGKPPSS